MISLKVSVCCIALFAFVFAGAAESATDKASCEPGPQNVPNPSPERDARAPDHFYFQIPTTAYLEDESDSEDAGLIVFEVNRTWAPIGVDRFYALAADNFYDCAAFFRVVPNFIVQWGIASDPGNSEKWDTKIADDPVLESNTAGMVSFATAGPGTRTTQIFVNTADNLFLDRQGFAPFAKVVQGMDVLTGNVLNVPNPVPDQQQYRVEGNTWLLTDYPEVDIIKGLPQPDDGASTSDAITTKIRYSLNDGDEHENDTAATGDKADPTSDNINIDESDG